LVCFAIDSHASLENVTDKVPERPPFTNAAEILGLCLQWYPEVRHFCPNTPVLLVGLKSDLRHNARAISILRTQGQAPITFQEVFALRWLDSQPGQCCCPINGSTIYWVLCQTKQRSQWSVSSGRWARRRKPIQQKETNAKLHNSIIGSKARYSIFDIGTSHGIDHRLMGKATCSITAYFFVDIFKFLARRSDNARDIHKISFLSYTWISDTNTQSNPIHR